LYFTIMDFKGATRLFADPDFDGEPVVVCGPRYYDPVVPPEEMTPPGVGKPEPPLMALLQRVATTLVLIRAVVVRPEPSTSLDDVDVRVAVERSQYLDADGKLVTEDYRVLLKDDIRRALQAEFGTMTDFLRRWNSAERKQAVLQELGRSRRAARNTAASRGQWQRVRRV